MSHVYCCTWLSYLEVELQATRLQRQWPQNGSLHCNICKQNTTGYFFKPQDLKKNADAFVAKKIRVFLSVQSANLQACLWWQTRCLNEASGHLQPCLCRPKTGIWSPRKVFIALTKCFYVQPNQSISTTLRHDRNSHNTFNLSVVLQRST